MRPALGAAAAAVGAFVLFFVVEALSDGEAAGWEQVSSMPQRRSYIAAAELDGRIYTAGGMVGDTGRPLATVTRYDPARDAWETLPQLPVPTRAAAGAAADGIFYVIGGTTADGNTTAVWAWDGEEWSERAPLPSPRFNHSAVALDSRIYVLGGFHEGRELREVLVYDPSRDEWMSAPALPRRNHAFDVVVVGGELWAIGGRRDEQVLREVWILDPAQGWRAGPEMPEPMELLGAAVVGDEIHAVWESTYQILDLGSGDWSSGPTPNVTRHALQTFHVDGALYTVGGCTTALRDSPIVERRRL
jgi:Kelch motif